MVTLTLSEIISEVKRRVIYQLQKFFPNFELDAYKINHRLIKNKIECSVILITVKNDKGQEKGIYAKISIVSHGQSDIYNEFLMLQNYYSRFHSVGERLKVPRLLAYYRDINALLTEKEDGILFKNYFMQHNTIFSSNQSRESINENIVMCADWLRYFHAFGDKENSAILSNTFIKKFDNNMAMLFTYHHDIELKQKLSNLRSKLDKYIGLKSFAITSLHGDFCINNIIINNKSICVIDLSYIRKELIYFDISYFVLSLMFINPLIKFTYYNNTRIKEFCKIFLDRYFSSKGGINQTDLFFIDLYSILHLCYRIYLHYLSLKNFPKCIENTTKFLIKSHYGNLIKEKVEHIEKKINIIFSPSG